MSIEALETLVVEDFRYSNSRRELWKGLSFVINRLVDLKIPCEICINGSFLTKKNDPNDIDLLVDIQISVLDNADHEQGDFIERLADRFYKKSDHLDSFVIFSASEGHQAHAASEAQRLQFARDWGTFYVSKEPKGIAVIEVPP
jgi:hypothetical protein